MAQFLRENEVVSADVIAIQEPWENPFQDNTHHPLKQTHELIYPQASETEGRGRVCIFIAKRLEHTHLAHSRDCQEVRIKTELSGELRIINVYNDQQHGAALRLLQEMLPPTREQQGVSYLILGDFNLHHPVWGGDDAPRDARAEDLLDLMEITGLDNWLTPGTVTRDQAGSQSTIDLVLASYSLREQMVVCEVNHNVHADSDHLPLLTLLDNNVPEAADPVKRRNWKAMDVEKFVAFASANLSTMQLLKEPTPREIDYAADHLIDIVQQAAQESTPWAKPSSWARQG